MKTEKQIAQEYHDELVYELVEKNIELDSAHLHEPSKKQDNLCIEIMRIEQRISLLEKRYKL